MYAVRLPVHNSLLFQQYQHHGDADQQHHESANCRHQRDRLAVKPLQAILCRSLISAGAFGRQLRTRPFQSVFAPVIGCGHFAAISFLHFGRAWPGRRRNLT